MSWSKWFGSDPDPNSKTKLDRIKYVDSDKMDEALAMIYESMDDENLRKAAVAQYLPISEVAYIDGLVWVALCGDLSDPRNDVVRFTESDPRASYLEAEFGGVQYFAKFRSYFCDVCEARPANLSALLASRLVAVLSCDLQALLDLKMPEEDPIESHNLERVLK